MAFIDHSEVVIGDYLRDKSDGCEGRVVAIEGNLITILMWNDCPGDPERQLLVSDLYRRPLSEMELLRKQNNELTAAVDQLILNDLLGL